MPRLKGKPDEKMILTLAGRSVTVVFTPHGRRGEKRIAEALRSIANIMDPALPSSAKRERRKSMGARR
jgi:hypothetical protein